MPKTRVFIGIKSSREIIKKVSEWRQIHKGVYNSRWIADENLHITLIPPWYTEDLDEIKSKMNPKDFNLKPFFIHFYKISLGPQPDNPRLLWAEAETPKELFQLKRIAEKVFNKIPENKPFKTHMTVLRFGRKDKGKLFREKEYKINWIEKAVSLTLFESKLTPSGAFYKTLKNINLNI